MNRKIVTRDMRLSYLGDRLEKSFVIREYPDHVSALVHVLSMKKDLIVDSPKGKKTILKKDYEWLEILPKGRNIYLTVLFDEEGVFQEIYFDIIRNASFDDPSDPSFEDLFLDAVYDKDGSIYVLDEEELEEAYKQKVIAQEEYEAAWHEMKRLLKDLKENGEAWKYFCIEERKKLLY